jgi:Na+/H+-dicarboxylate symporter
VSPEKNSSDKLAGRILWSLVVGLALGLTAKLFMEWQPATAGPIETFAVEVLDPIGQIFLRLLFFVVVPLVFASLCLGVVQLGRLDKLGPLAGKTFLIFGFNMSVAVAIGLVLMNVVNPGAQIDEGTKEILVAQYDAAAQAMQERAARTQFTFASVVEMFMPRNLLAAVVDFQILPLILFAILIGAAGTSLAPEPRARLQLGLETVVFLMTRIVRFALWLAPVAVPALIFSAVVKFGLGLLAALALFVGAVLAGMLLHLAGTMSLLLKMFTRRSPAAFFRAIRTILVTAFSTSSSSATLPTSIQVSREQLGISPSTAGFVLPLGATMNMSGTALYEGCVVLFVAQVYGVELGIAQQITLLLLAVLSSVAVAGIPGGSLPLIVGLLVNFGIPAEGIALILGIDRLLDMSRTVLNVGADVVTACIVDEQMSGKISPPPALEVLESRKGGG